MSGCFGRVPFFIVKCSFSPVSCAADRVNSTAREEWCPVESACLQNCHPCDGDGLHLTVLCEWGVRCGQTAVFHVLSEKDGTMCMVFNLMS